MQQRWGPLEQTPILLQLPACLPEGLLPRYLSICLSIHAQRRFTHATPTAASGRHIHGHYHGTRGRMRAHAHVAHDTHNPSQSGANSRCVPYPPPAASC